MADVIVVGAGPAGSTAAAVLAKLGRHVLLVDRSEFPRDKPCGDAIQGHAIALLRDLGYSDPLDPAQFTSISDWSIQAPSRAVASAQLDAERIAHPPMMARRLDFDHLVFRQALANGAEYCQAQVTGVLREGQRVVGVEARPHGEKTNQEFRAPIVIAADGATSLIARAVRDERDADRHWAVAVRCYVTMRERLDHHSEFYFDRAILPGYAWVFPIGDAGANIGVGMRLDRYRKHDQSLETMLDSFLDRLGGRVERASIQNVRSWQIPLGSRRASRAFDGCLLVGDAGSFVDPLLGAGIYFGMKTGQLAAEVAHAALHDDDTSQARLREFDTRWKAAIGPTLRRATVVQRLVIGYPWMVNAVIGFASLNTMLGRRIVMALSGEKL